ncbi:MAG: hypothetical protein ACRD7E_08760 [Bryobacteraceae bacterium]
MRTKKQIEASRKNGARSSGPASMEGKARSARNATRHGLSSNVVVLSSENSDAFKELLEAYIDHWQPVGQPELDLVHDIVGARWRLNRTLALESASIDLEMDRQRAHVEEHYARIDEPSRCALAFNALADAGRSLGILSRHEARLRRAIDRAGAELLRLQLQRSEVEENARSEWQENARREQEENHRGIQPENDPVSAETQNCTNEPKLEQVPVPQPSTNVPAVPHVLPFRPDQVRRPALEDPRSKLSKHDLSSA